LSLDVSATSERRLAGCAERCASGAFAEKTGGRRTGGPLLSVVGKAAGDLVGTTGVESAQLVQLESVGTLVGGRTDFAGGKNIVTTHIGLTLVVRVARLAQRFQVLANVKRTGALATHVGSAVCVIDTRFAVLFQQFAVFSKSATLVVATHVAATVPVKVTQLARVFETVSCFATDRDTRLVRLTTFEICAVLSADTGCARVGFSTLCAGATHGVVVSFSATTSETRLTSAFRRLTIFAHAQFGTFGRTGRHVVFETTNLTHTLVGVLAKAAVG